VEVDRLLTVVNHIVKSDATHWVSLEYLVNIVSGVPTNACADENKELRWFSIDALPDLITQPTREALEAYVQSIR
jgi:8-oxo-dGTP diphosphatase